MVKWIRRFTIVSLFGLILLLFVKLIWQNLFLKFQIITSLLSIFAGVVVVLLYRRGFGFSEAKHFLIGLIYRNILKKEYRRVRIGFGDDTSSDEMFLIFGLVLIIIGIYTILY